MRRYKIAMHHPDDRPADKNTADTRAMMVGTIHRLLRELFAYNQRQQIVQNLAFKHDYDNYDEYQHIFDTINEYIWDVTKKKNIIGVLQSEVKKLNKNLDIKHPDATSW